MSRLNFYWGVAALAAFALSAGTAAAVPADCANADALGVSRTVEIDTTGGPGFGFEHYKANDFLQQKEVVLTFDDGPQKFSTEAVLKALADQCTKATFFSIGKMALGYPEIIREVAKGGHTIGTHTWSHQAIRKLKTFEEGRDEIERGASAVKRAVGGPIAPFFRYPTLVDTPESLAHLGKRNISMFSTDIDSFDFKIQPPEGIVKTVMTKLDKNGKGIILMHDIHKTTAKALPLLLTALKANGYKVVHLKAKEDLKTLAEYDALIEKDTKGLPQVASDRPVSSIVRTIEGDAPESEKPAAAAKPVPAVPTAAVAPAPAPAGASEDVPQVVPAASETNASAAADDATRRAAADGAEAKTPVTTGSIERPEAPVGAPAGAESAEAADTSAPVQGKSWSARAVEIWEMWFGK
jgi:peptidoglycan/xylan/chitin deacetylase (PgdA/CDA1 family)